MRTQSDMSVTRSVVLAVVIALAYAAKDSNRNPEVWTMDDGPGTPTELLETGETAFVGKRGKGGNRGLYSRKPTRSSTKAPITKAPTMPPTPANGGKGGKGGNGGLLSRKPTRSPTPANGGKGGNGGLYSRKPTRSPTKAPITKAPTRSPTKAPTTKAPTPPTALCGHDLGSLGPLLQPPAEVKKLLAYGFGIGYGITTMANSPSSACQSLKVLGDEPFVAVSIGAEEGEKTKKEGKKSSKLVIGTKTWAPAVAVFPVCMAIRPCELRPTAVISKMAPSVTFGFYSETGIPVAVVSGVKFTFNGNAASASSLLTAVVCSRSCFLLNRPVGSANI